MDKQGISTEKTTQKQFLLYLVLGGLLTLCEWIGFYALVYIAKVHYLLSSVIMFVVISALGLVVYKRAIFGASHLSAKAEVSVIYAINIAGLGVNSFILWFLVEIVGLESLLGKIIASFLTAFYSFFARKIWVYKADDKIQSARKSKRGEKISSLRALRK